MIFGSLLLIFAAIALAVLGVLHNSNALLVGSIAASLLAALTLIVGARQSAGAPILDEATPRDEPVPAVDPDAAWARREPGGTVYAGGGMTQTDPTGIGTGVALLEAPDVTTTVDGADPIDFDRPVDFDFVDQPVIHPRQTIDLDLDGDVDQYIEGVDDPADEPAVEPVTPAMLRALSQLDDEVLVLDGRPRFHLDNCVYVIGAQSEPLPVSEAVELGFSPCAHCQPGATLVGPG